MSSRNEGSTPTYDEETNLFTLKCYYGGLLDYDCPYPHCRNGNLVIFDDIDADEFTLEMLRLLLESVGVVEEQRYYILAEEHGFHQVKDAKELKEMVREVLNDDRVFQLYSTDSKNPRIGRPKYDDYSDDDHDDPDYDCNEAPVNDSEDEWSDRDSEYDDEEEEHNGLNYLEEASVLQPKDVKKFSLSGFHTVKGNIQQTVSLKQQPHIDEEANIDEYDDDLGKGTDSGDDFGSLHGSDEDVTSLGTVFDPKDMFDPPLVCGMFFSNFKECKEAIKSWNIKRGRPFKFVKNDKVRVKAVCPLRAARVQCDWEITARNRKGDGAVQIRSFQMKHKCGFKYKNKSITSAWVAHKYKELLRSNPRLDTKTFRSQVMKENRMFITSIQGYKAKRKALKLVQGTEVDQFGLLPRYIAELRRSNPGSTVVMKMVDGFRDTTTGQPRFERVYVCFAGVKSGFLVGCRKVLFLDGTFLKGACGGVLLTAVGIDPNNGFYPLAYAVTEGENGSSWCWFLSILRDDLSIENSEGWTLMSDKQKGLIQACELVFSRADHRYCVKHLHSNWATAGFKGVALRKCLWAAAKATTPAQFREKMEILAAINLEAAQWLNEKPPSEWSRSYFKVEPKCDVLLNNHSESFNGKILEHREQPVISMLEGIRLYIMERLQANRDKARTVWSNKLVCPRIFKIVDKNSETATYCVPHKSNDENVEVWGDYGDKFAVNVKDRTCTCRRWDLTGIPCVHAISAIWALNEEPMEYVNDLYSLEKYQKCYEYAILPICGESEWPQVDVPIPLPPIYGKAPGRPKKNRRRGEIEQELRKEKRQRMTRVGNKGKCSFCGEEGHNRRSCRMKNNCDDEEVQAFDICEEEQLLDDDTYALNIDEAIIGVHDNDKTDMSDQRITRQSSKCSVIGRKSPISEPVQMDEGHVKKSEASMRARTRLQLGKVKQEKVETEEAIRRTSPISAHIQVDEGQPRPRTRLQLGKVKHEECVSKKVTTRAKKIPKQQKSLARKETPSSQSVRALQKPQQMSQQNIDVVQNSSKPPSVPTTNFAEMDYEAKYKLFGLVPPPFPPGSKPNLQNRRATVGKLDQSMIERNNSETQRTYSKEYIEGVRSAYKFMGIQLPSSQDGSGGSQSLSQGPRTPSVYEMFGIPLPTFLGGVGTLSQGQTSNANRKDKTKK